jgi:hypothetical protein
METLALGNIEHRLDSPWDTGLLGEAGKPTVRKRMQGVADGLDTPANVLSNLGWSVVLRTRE